MIKWKKIDKTRKFQKNNYHIWTNGRLLSLILIGLSLLFLILSIIELPILSAVPGYTVGFLFGYYSYIFYFFIIYYSTCKLFNINIYLIKKISKFKVLNYSWLNVFILTFGIMLIIETSIYINNNNEAFPGVDAWTDNFTSWWKNFTSFNDPTKPNINNTGVIVSLILSILYSLGGTIIAIIFSLSLIFYFIFYLLYSSPIKKIGNKRAAKKRAADLNQEYETKIVDLSFEDENKIIVSEFGDKIVGDATQQIELLIEAKKQKSKSKTTLFPTKQLKNNKNEKRKTQESIIMEIEDDPEELIDIPFDNPFEQNKIVVSTSNITDEVKVKKRGDIKLEDTEFLFNNIVENKKEKSLNIYNETHDIKIKKKNKKKNKE